MLCPTAFVAWYLCPFTRGSTRFNSTHGRGVLGRGLHLELSVLPYLGHSDTYFLYL